MILLVLYQYLITPYYLFHQCQFLLNAPVVQDKAHGDYIKPSGEGIFCEEIERLGYTAIANTSLWVLAASAVCWDHCCGVCESHVSTTCVWVFFCSMHCYTYPCMWWTTCHTKSPHHQQKPRTFSMLLVATTSSSGRS